MTINAEALSTGDVYRNLQPKVAHQEEQYKNVIAQLESGDMSLQETINSQRLLAEYSNFQSFTQKTIDNMRKMTDENIKANNA